MNRPYTVMEFLFDYAGLYCRRMQAELKKDVSLRFYNDEDTGNGVVELSHNGNAIVLEAEHPLEAVLSGRYQPQLTEEEWQLFLMEVCPWRFPMLTETVQ